MTKFVEKQPLLWPVLFQLALPLKGDSDTWKDTKFIWLHIFRARVHPAPSAPCRMDGVDGQKTLFHCIPLP